MAPRDLSLLLLVGLIWGFNFVVTKLVLSGWGDFDGAPPVFFAFVRFAILGLILFPFLRPVPQDFGKITAVALLMGAAHFVFLYWGIEIASPSSAAVVIQLVAPFTTVLSIVMLNEQVGWRRWAGVTAAFSGVTIIALDPGAFSVSIGLALVAISAFVAALASVLIKRLKPLSPLRMQAWTGVLSAPPLLAVSLMTEDRQVTAMVDGGWGMVAALAYVVILASIIGHSAYYVMLRRYDASLVAPIALTAPIWAVIFSVMLLDDPFTWRLIFGGGLTVAGVMVISIRTAGKIDAVRRA